MSDRIRLKQKTLVGKSWGTLTDHSYDYRTQDGHWQTHRREVYDHGHAAAILPYDPEAGTVVLVRQFRLPPHLNGDEGFLLEAPAGLLDGEDPETAARREVVEETGIEPVEIAVLGPVYPSPGSLNEKLFLFIGTYRAPAPQTRGGLAHEGEDIEVIELTLDAALDLIGSGAIIDVKTIVLLQHLALKRMRGKS